MRKLSIVASTVLVTALSAVAGESTVDSEQLRQQALDTGLQPIPQSEKEILDLVDNPDNPMTDKKVALGKKLYFDPALSKSNLISCNTCHNLASGGDDGVQAAVGHKWTENPHHLNSPTVWNSVLHDVQFWDGRSPHLADQAQGPIQAGPEMAAPPKLVEERINTIPGYVDGFKNAYGPDVDIDFELIAETIAVFERTLITPSRYDEFLHGHDDALTEEEKEGLKVFMDKGCTACHNSMGLGGTMQTIQTVNDYSFSDNHLGDFSGDENGMVKTPTLRNIEETAPYLHNGQLWSLKKTVKEMSSTQLGMQLEDGDADKIVTFLKSLTGEKPEITYPTLPTWSDETPKPAMD
ncbi:MAG: cytochrome-c peroxidase [Campylobacterota bacterium]